MKKSKGIKLETILERALKDDDIRLGFEERKFYLQVARLIGRLRAKRGLSQEEVASAAGVSQPLIARLERGDQSRTPTFDTLFKVLKALGYTLELRVQSVKTRTA